MRAVLLSGSGRYSDPWHPFDETSAIISELLEECGLEVELRTDVDDALASITLPDLLVVNVGLPRDGEPSPAVHAQSGLARLLAEVPLLAFHASATSFLDSPEWPVALGGRWVRGVTMHPPRGVESVRVTDAAHPVTEGLADFVVDDERYSYLEVHSSGRVLLDQEFEGERHPVLWCTESAVYDALGHDAGAFTPEHREVIRRSIRWLLTTR